MKIRRKRALAFIMAMFCVIPSAACATLKEENPTVTETIVPTQTGENNMETAEINIGTDAMQLAGAVYPEMAKYPQTDGFTWDEEAYRAWRTSLDAQQPENTEYQNGIREFYEVTMQEFLKDTEGENKVYSPLNVYMALAMLAETTDGESRAQILKLLHTDSIETLRNNASILWNANYCDDGTVTSLLASSIWLNDKNSYNMETLETLAKYYYASSYSGRMGSEEYNQMLRDWLNEQTGGLLEEQAEKIELDPQAVLALATTVYFRAKWANEFQQSNNTEEIFHAATGDVKTEFMHQSGTNTYYWGENFGAISRRLENSGTMLFLLPDEDVKVEDLLTDTEALDFIYDHAAWENQKFLIVNQSVPKFDAASDYSIVEGLKNLGVTDVFDFSKSDFTPLLSQVDKTGTENISVDAATHAARVMIDEEGCIAAAFTVMIACGAARPPEEQIDFVLDRPFMFVINGQDGQPLFIGIVNQPK